MKQLFSYIVLLLLCVFSSCSQEDNIWNYGEKQDLENSKWIVKLEDSLDGDFSTRQFTYADYIEILNFESNKLTMTCSYRFFDEKGQLVEERTKTKFGNYDYKHPHIKIVYEDGSEHKAHISTRNTIFYYHANRYLRVFERLQNLEVMNTSIRN